MTGFTLPSVLPPKPALQDTTTTPDQLQAANGLARVTNPTETPIFICGFESCDRLFPSRDRVMFHRKRDHDSEDDSLIITWNE
ncbi:hypothetical protein BJ138DRAFT_1123285 [Hygrophoropsis aurantiaca]|uniref:Uncharacterized protein n=1 Tax=Hygrophoropsis aurantiaca TaxID=72124 RepID=A0ACB8ANM5_9AGAM|nr:hypothetical protein BJ138DRAFT_1123285 [Hygrophoropsis aurantiaca]